MKVYTFIVYCTITSVHYNIVYYSVTLFLIYRILYFVVTTTLYKCMKMKMKKKR